MSGSASTPDLDLIADAISSCADVEKLISLKAFSAPDALLIGAKVALPSDKTLHDVADLIAEVERIIREHAPEARAVYVQPDIYRPSIDPAPPTDVFVLKSAD